VEPLAPQMLRIVLGGEELAGFTSLGFDDHVKVFVPGEGAGPVARDFTPRRFDPEKSELWLDFFLHEAGPATAWAAQATPGQSIEIGGPKGSAVIEMQDIDLHVLIGDETALPAIGRRLEELPANARALALIETEHGADRPALSTRADLEVAWVSRDLEAASPAGELITALRRLHFPLDRCFAWIAHETQVARAIRAHLRDERGMNKKWIKAAGYWQRGASGTHQAISD